MSYGVASRSPFPPWHCLLLACVTNKTKSRIYIMIAAILLVTIPPGHTPGDLQYFSFLEVYSPLPGMQKETISHPRASNQPHMRFLLHLLDKIKINKQGSQLCFTDLNSWV